jgi:amino acid adenylation domain-containing protein
MAISLRESVRTLRTGFLESWQRWPERTALEVEGRALSYSELGGRAATLAAALDAVDGGSGPPLTAVFAQRSVTAFAGVLAALFRGHGYVPLNPSFPVERTRQMLLRSECRALIVDVGAARDLDALLAGVSRALTIALPGGVDAETLRQRWPDQRFVTAEELAAAADWQPRPVEPNAIAYLLFTSGSTGVPKGVMVANRNATHFIDAMVERYAITEHDRFSQLFDFTFDLSAFDLFVAWQCGACVCCPSAQEKSLPANFVRDARLTIWFSVPSTAHVLDRLRKLQPGAFPGLRVSLFCGEALPVELARRWSRAAAASIVENLYGPTELTISCTLYRYDPERTDSESEGGLVPIGEPYPGMRAIVVDESLREVEAGEPGELLMTGPQLSLGYWNDAERTRAAFVVPPGQSEVFYRTGDRVRRPLAGRPLVYLGRVDNQIKIQGYRVELGEVEAVLREVAGVEVAIAVGWPPTSSGADGIVGFIGAETADSETIRQRAISRLPPYMHPSEIHLVSEWPLNANGKIDRNALRAMLAADNPEEG